MIDILRTAALLATMGRMCDLPSVLKLKLRQRNPLCLRQRALYHAASPSPARRNKTTLVAITHSQKKAVGMNTSPDWSQNALAVMNPNATTSPAHPNHSESAPV